MCNMAALAAPSYLSASIRLTRTMGLFGSRRITNLPSSRFMKSSQSMRMMPHTFRTPRMPRARPALCTRALLVARAGRVLEHLDEDVINIQPRFTKELESTLDGQYWAETQGRTSRRRKQTVFFSPC